MVKKLNPKELGSYREQLVKLRGILTGDIKHLQQEAFGADGERPSTEGEAEGGSDSYAQEFSLELLERDENALREIDDALARIADGSYGLCEVCAEPISKERLKFLPHSRNCVNCQRSMERNR
jgi:RNA polymerase-binding transcription factor DksA